MSKGARKGVLLELARRAPKAEPKKVAVNFGGRPRTLFYDYNAYADAEERGGMTLAELFSPQRLGWHTLRLTLWAGLRHEDRALTVERTGKMLGDWLAAGGDLRDLVAKMNEAMGACAFAVEERM